MSASTPSSGSTAVVPVRAGLEGDCNYRPLPLDPLPNDGVEANRLWVGNLDSRITEYNLIKLLQKYGTVAKFNYLFHKAGPQVGQPKGYCFVTYETREQAELALRRLDGRLALSKRLCVKWAYTQTKCGGMASTMGGGGGGDADPLRPSTASTACKDQAAAAAAADPNASISSKILAIEAKLRLMEENRDHTEAQMPILSFINQAAQGPQNGLRQGGTSSLRRRPYYRHPPRRKHNSRET